MIHIHFETRADKPSVFHMTPELVQAAAKRAKPGRGVRWTVGEDLRDMGWLATAEGLVTGNDLIVDPAFPKATLATAAPKLRWIHIIGAGIEPLLPLRWLPQQVTLTNNSGVHVQKTGEFATLALLALCYRLPEMLGNQHQARWRPIFTPSIAGKTLLVVGLGDMGGAAAKAAKRLGMRVLGMRRNPRPHRHADAILPLTQLHKGLAQADFVLVATPLTPATAHLIDARAIAAMKTGAGLINVGRAGVVDYAALSEALRSGKLSGAVLDVFDPEPLPADLAPVAGAEPHHHAALLVRRPGPLPAADLGPGLRQPGQAACRQEAEERGGPRHWLLREPSTMQQPADLFDPRHYAAVRKPLLQAETMPPWSYTSPPSTSARSSASGARRGISSAMSSRSPSPATIWRWNSLACRSSSCAARTTSSAPSPIPAGIAAPHCSMPAAAIAG